jgi:hypothetical protein
MFTETMVKCEEEPIRVLERVIQFCTVEQVNWKIKFLAVYSKGLSKCIHWILRTSGRAVCVYVCVFTIEIQDTTGCSMAGSGNQ